ncbi:MAG: site-specific integrase, partial [Ruminococcus sp.]|nr:site-specific integrase [Ruminococcus sp.]
MATIRKRGDAYQIRVSVGYDTKGRHKEQAMTWKPEPGMTEKQIQKELNRQAVMFEEKCAHGYCATAVKFQDLAEEWFDLYAKYNLRKTTYQRMTQLTKRVYPAVGHLRMDKITARQLQGFINSLAQDGANMRT